MYMAPDLDNFIYQNEESHFGNSYNRFTKKSWEKIIEFYKVLDKLKPNGNDNNHTIYFKLPRGKIEDFGDYEEYESYGEVKNKKEFYELWKSYYPKEEKWYCMSTLHFDRDGKEFYFLIINQKIILRTEEQHNLKFENDVSDDFENLIIIVNEIIEQIKANEYNEYLENNLDKSLRFGTITRKDFYKLFPGSKQYYLEDLTQNEINEFQKNVKLQVKEWKNDRANVGRLEKMNAKDFYDFCLVGYNANNYKKHDGLTSKEAYYKYADGRDDGLGKIDENSYDEFKKWLLNPDFHQGGHPWEVCRGGNSTHISLYVVNDEKGFYLILDGKSFGRSIETIRFFNALKKIGAPIFLNDAQNILNRLLGNDKIGIVPYYVTPRYCESYFPNEKILDFMHLDNEKEEEMVKLVKWQRIESYSLNK